MCEIAKWVRRYNYWYVLRKHLVDKTIDEEIINQLQPLSIIYFCVYDWIVTYFVEWADIMW